MKCPCCNGTGIIETKRSRTDLLIETYYRSRAAGGKITLKQLADQAGITATYLSTKKTAYDKAGKWGSKRVKP